MSGVTEFVIMSGPEVHDYLMTVRKQLRTYLAASFPQYRFSLVSQDNEGMGFVVVPVVGSVGDGWTSQQLHEPDPQTIFEIKMALEAFRPNLETVH
ncbi:hypothetical protein [Devosia riboflavina]